MTPYYELTRAEAQRLRRILISARTMFGSLTPDAQHKILELVRRPGIETWEEAHGIVIWPKPGFGKTIWQAFLDMGPSFPRVGRTTDGEGNLIKEWELPPEWGRDDQMNWPFLRDWMMQALEEALLTGQQMETEQGYREETR